MNTVCWKALWKPLGFSLGLKNFFWQERNSGSALEVTPSAMFGYPFKNGSRAQQGLENLFILWHWQAQTIDCTYTKLAQYEGNTHTEPWVAHPQARVAHIRLMCPVSDMLLNVHAQSPPQALPSWQTWGEISMSKTYVWSRLSILQLWLWARNAKSSS